LARKSRSPEDSFSAAPRLGAAVSVLKEYVARRQEIILTALVIEYGAGKLSEKTIYGVAAEIKTLRDLIRDIDRDMRQAHVEMAAEVSRGTKADNR
jgi:hypothetical protein